MTNSSEQHPCVSILIPAYNAVLTLAAALDSVLSQTWEDYEVLVIDDGSSDGTRELVEQYGSRFNGRLRYFYQGNSGLAVARNIGIKESRGEFLALLDADDIWLPQRLARTVEVIRRSPQIGLVHANITRIDAKGAVRDTPQRDLRYLEGEMFDNLFLRKAHVSCPTVLFRKDCVAAVGMFDEKLARLGCEDRELWLRIAQQFRVVYINEVLAYYRLSADSMSRDRDKMLKARLYVVDKHFAAEGEDLVLRRQALAQIYRDLGDEDLLHASWNLARENYWQAIRLNPVSFWPWMNLGKTFFKRGNH